MREQFYSLADYLTGQLHADEVLLLNYGGEDSDFVRLTKNLVRQAGAVSQKTMSLELVRGQRHAVVSLGLTGSAEEDRAASLSALRKVRDTLGDVLDDPYLLYATEVHSGEQEGPDRLPQAPGVVEETIRQGGGCDLVGIYAQGGIYNGFANSLGQRNWFSSHSFQLDWSLYHRADKAVKAAYAGFEWDSAAFAAKMASARGQLEVLAAEPKTVPPGEYRVYLAPAALEEYVRTLCWGGFGLKAHRTKGTPLLKMQAGATLSPSVGLAENTREGIAANFQSAGFLKPDRVSLIDGGRLDQLLVSPRSAREYGVPPNGANGGEVPESLDMAAGDIDAGDVLRRLDTGVYVNTLWYLNYSDRPACRITGMTRFATFWVEGGRIVAPLNVMRFDDTAFRVLGENLVGLTRQRDFIPSASTYGARSTDSSRLPGAIVDKFAFTL
jgi:predicted Zn-dependent protease